MRGLILICALSVSACASVKGLRTDLSADAIPTAISEIALKNGLLEAFDLSKGDAKASFKPDPTPDQVRRFLRSGMTLTDIYCDKFFRQTNLSLRKRKFGRSATNDVGTAIAAILGLSSVGPHTISGVATGFGLADSSWRNYDDSFVVSPDLEMVRSLVLAAQDDFRHKTLADPPTDYMTARSDILRYAGICSYLGMQTLMNHSVDDQRQKLQNVAAATIGPAPPQRPPAATPPINSSQSPAAAVPSVPK